MPNFYTYLWLREDGTPYYVGKGKGYRAYDNASHNVARPFNKENILIQEWPSEQDAFEAEKFLILYYGRKDLNTGYLRNITNGGDGASGAVRSLETRRKIQQANLGKILSEETKKKISASNLGKKLSPSHIEKLRILGKLRKHTEEEKRKIGLGNLGKIMSKESRIKMSLAKRKLSSDQRKRIIELRKDGFTHDKIASLCFVSRPTISRYLNSVEL